MEFIRNLFKGGKKPAEAGSDEARGTAPLQSPEEQDATRARMEAEMAEQRERRESPNADKTDQ